jgi:hypothetical protein
MATTWDHRWSAALALSRLGPLQHRVAGHGSLCADEPEPYVSGVSACGIGNEGVLLAALTRPSIETVCTVHFNHGHVT